MESDLKRQIGRAERETLSRLLSFIKKEQEISLEECFVDGFLLGVRMTLGFK
ncbi:hypothetical protein [Clostridium sp. D33t1_170424_F3]|uniref:hypothetical protein n=1 Tax=Clostridium sp. D33t1_170424_F3 TaxID=2787099 RepID=UPI003369DA1C